MLREPYRGAVLGIPCGSPTALNWNWSPGNFRLTRARHSNPITGGEFQARVVPAAVLGAAETFRVPAGEAFGLTVDPCVDPLCDAPTEPGADCLKAVLFEGPSVDRFVD
jgi:hypothetical protein